MQHIPGYRINVHSSLTTPILLAGAPRHFTILNGTICAALTIGLHAVYLLPVFIIFQAIAVMLTKQDPQFFAVFLRHMKQKKYYQV